MIKNTTEITLYHSFNSELPNNYIWSLAVDSQKNIWCGTRNGLVKFDASMNIVPDLAKSWEIADETTYVFHLHKGITFHDGNECTAEDVKFSIERIIDPKTGSPGRDKFVRISDIVAVDPYTV